MSTEHVRKYNPSWVNRLTTWVGSLPGWSWLYYASIGLVIMIALSLILWLEGAAPVGTFLPAHIYLIAAMAFILSIIYYFDKRAVHALEIIKPSLTISDDEYLGFKYRLANLPSTLTLAAGIAAVLFILLTEFISGDAYQIETLAGFSLSSSALRAIYLICWWFFGVFIYHSIHQLSLINRIYSDHTRIDIFRLEPLYGFSTLAALTALSLIVLPYGFYLINPTIQLMDPFVLSSYVIITLVAVVTFIVPQLGIHRLQAQEKERLLDEAYRHYEITANELHKKVADQDFSEIGNISMALSSLEMEINTIKATSTWPWQPGTLRWLFTALLLPLLMWLAQFFLGQILN